MNGGGAWIATIAVAVVVMAIAQLVLAVVASRAARQASDTLLQFRRDVQPILERAHQISAEAARAVALASAQIDRVDGMLASTAACLDQTLSLVQGAVVGPARQGAALVAAFRAAFSVFKSVADRQRTARDEEEALFVG